MNKSRKQIWMYLITTAFLLSGCGKTVDVNIAETNTWKEREIQSVDDNYRDYYEIFVSSFYDSDSDGIGDLQGVIEKLDYIEDMGFNGIWLMPIMPSPTYHKYDVTNYCAIDESYGTMDDFEELITKCHEKDICVIIDMVMNHTSSKHPWFVEACTYLENLEEGQEPKVEECPYIEYYEFTKEKLNETYYQVGDTDWYYEGSFWSEMPDLKLESEAVRTEFENISDFWMEKGIDGYRMDAVMHYKESDTTFNNETLSWIYTYCKEKNPDFYMVSEVWANVSTITDYYGSLTPSFFNFDLQGAEGKLAKTARGNNKAEKFVQSMLKYQEDFAEQNPNAIDAPFASNHDTSRVSASVRSDENAIKMTAGLLLTMNGSPFVYYGEEIGMPSAGTKDENKRLPMLWSDEDTTGMTKAPANADEDITYKFAGVEEQLLEEDSILNYYKKALRLRKENPEIARGDIEIIEELTHENQAVITKSYAGSTIGIVYNTGKEAIELSLAETKLSDMEICGCLCVTNEDASLENKKLVVPAQTIVILYENDL